MRRRMLATATVLAAAGTVVAGPMTAANAAPVCTVDFAVNQWSTGFTADVQVTNGGAAVTSWTLAWTYAGNQRITNAWNASVTQSGAAVTATSLAWNGSLATGASTRFGFQGTYSGTNTVPSAFTFNGVSCGGDTPPPTTTPPTTLPPMSPPPTTPPPTTPPPTTPPPTTPPPTTPPPTTPPPGTGGGDSFETDTGAWTTTAPDCSGAGTAAIDRTVAHTGSASMRVNGAAGYCNHVFVRNTRILAGTTDVWFVRYWVRHTTALPTSHVTTVALTDAADGNRDLRFGGQNGALQFNRASDDATLPEQSPAGVALSRPLPTGTWNCVEFKVDGRDGTIETWLNGASVPGLVADGVPTHDVDGQWLNSTWRPRLTDLKLGWESYGEGADTLWYDDVAVSASRNGC